MGMRRRSRLTEEREAKGMSKSDLARLANMQAGVISWIETGRFFPYESQMEKIAAALGWEGETAELFREVAEDA